MNRHLEPLPRTLALLLGLVLLLASGFAAQRTLNVCRNAQRAEAATFGGALRACCAAPAQILAAPIVHQPAAHHGCCGEATGGCRSAEPAARTAAHPTEAPTRTPPGAALGHPDDPSLQGTDACAGGCCFAVDIDLENGPLPRALDTDVEAPLVAVLPITLPTGLASVVRVAAHPFATGPPGPDRRTALRRAIQLLI